MATPFRTDRRQMTQHFDTLCKKIGCRYSGTPAEQKAADYIEGVMHKHGLANVHQHRFGFPNWNYSSYTFTVGVGRNARKLTNGMPMCFSPATPRGGVHGEIIYLQSGSELDFKQNTRGKIGLIIGSLALGDPDVMRRLKRSGLVALIVVDSRIPYGWRTFLGAAPQWMEGYDIPTLGIPFLEAERIVRELPSRGSITIDARTFPAESQNIIGEIVGSQKPEEVIIVSGHHDSVLGMVGADDNASGVVFTLELARLFARRKPARTIRFISYGVEEKLSVGSYLYMRSLSSLEQQRIKFVLNADGVGGYVGTDVAYVTGSQALENLVKQTWSRRDHPCDVRREAVPYSDQFPFNICGVPSVWLTRPSIMTEGYWYLHSVNDNPEHISLGVLGRNIETSAALVDQIVNAKMMPFRREIAPGVMGRVRAMAKQTYRHPWKPEGYRYPKK